jgi:hypothetical protein
MERGECSSESPSLRLPSVPALPGVPGPSVLHGTSSSSTTGSTVPVLAPVLVLASSTSTDLTVLLVLALYSSPGLHAVLGYRY